MASYLQARQQLGCWYLRIDDIDPPREQRKACQQIIQALGTHGFNWDGDVQYQSRHAARYEQALEQLANAGQTFNCSCSRKQIAQTWSHANGSASPTRVYPGTCRNLKLSSAMSGKQTDNHYAVRFKVAGKIVFNDEIQGRFEQNLETEVGDFIVRRRDGLYSYQLANVVDDGATGITHIVRGADLLDNTPRQIALIDALGLAVPRYTHIPVAVNAEGNKLSKQTQATALDESKAVVNLQAAWRFLGQSNDGRPGSRSRQLAIGDATECDTIGAFWEKAVQDWDSRRIPRELTHPVIHT